MVANESQDAESADSKVKENVCVLSPDFVKTHGKEENLTAACFINCSSRLILIERWPSS